MTTPNNKKRPSAGPESNLARSPSNPHGNGNAASRKEGTQERREFIVRYLRGGRTRLPIKLLEERLSKKPGAESIKKDLEAFNKVGLRFVKEGDSLVDLDAQHTGNSEDRDEVNHSQKRLTAELAVSVILGMPHSWTSNGRSPGATTAENVTAGNKKNDFREAPRLYYSQDEILGLLAMCPKTVAKKTKDRVRSALLDYWHENSRMVSLDAGTTNLQVADILSGFPMPLRGTQLSYLTVTTNSRLIFQKLGDPEVPIRTIIIGGQQRGRTSAIAGTLSEVFVKSAGLLNFGMTILGATGIASNDRVCFSDTQEEAIMKSLLFSKSGLRIIAVDNSKLAKDSYRHAYSFCALDPSCVDLLITNAPILPANLDKRSIGKMEMQWAKKAYDEFDSIVEQIEERGVPVLVAESEQTKKFRLEKARNVFQQSMAKDPISPSPPPPSA